MTRRLTVLFAALEAVLAVAIGVAIPLVPLTEDIYEVTTLPLDGSPGRSITTGGGDQRWLVSSPVETEPTYVVSADGIVDLSSGRGAQQQEGIQLSSLTYVG